MDSGVNGQPCPYIKSVWENYIDWKLFLETADKTGKVADGD